MTTLMSESISVRTGRMRGPLTPGTMYHYQLEAHHSGQGHFVWRPDLGRLELNSVLHLAFDRDVAPPTGESVASFPGVTVNGAVYLIDLPSHLGLPALNWLEVCDPA